MTPALETFFAIVCFQCPYVRHGRPTEGIAGFASLQQLWRGRIHRWSQTFAGFETKDGAKISAKLVLLQVPANAHE